MHLASFFKIVMENVVSTICLIGFVIAFEKKKADIKEISTHIPIVYGNEPRIACVTSSLRGTSAGIIFPAVPGFKGLSLAKIGARR